MLEDLKLQELYQSLVCENDRFDVMLLYYDSNPENSYLQKRGWVFIKPGGKPGGNSNYKIITINNIMCVLKTDIIIIGNDIIVNANKIFDTTYLLFEYIECNNIKIKN